MRFDIRFSGHTNVRSLHQKTIEITTDTDLTPSGDCIVGIGADCGCAGIPDEMKKMMRRSDVQIRLSIIVNDEVFSVNGTGHERLELTHLHDIVMRKSRFVCPRTVAIRCDGSSDEIPRSMITALQDPAQNGILRIEVD